MWSVGCIMGELFMTKPVYYCRSDEEVLERVFQMLGTPTESHCSFLTKLPKYGGFRFTKHEKPKSLKEFFPAATPHALDLLSKLMALDPKDRITAKEAMNHPFFKAG